MKSSTTVMLYMLIACFLGAGLIGITDSALTKGMVLGDSGYTLHHGQGEKNGDYAIALYAPRLNMPSLTLSVSVSKDESRIVFMKDYGDRIVFYTDTDGDGLPDEGIERDKKNQTLKKFNIRCVIENK